MSILKQAENGVPVPELRREHGISNVTFYFYKWRAKHGFGWYATEIEKGTGGLSLLLDFSENRGLQKGNIIGRYVLVIHQD